MMVPMAMAQKIRDGTVTLAFRRWDAPRVKVGGTQMTSAGIIRFESCAVVGSLAELTESDAQAAGVPDLATLQERLSPDRPIVRTPRGGKGGDTIYRIGVSWVGDDPRVELRDRVASGRDLTRLIAAVDKLDAGKRSAADQGWTRHILEWIEANPGVLASELAAELDRELLGMKADIRKLKALGLTISLRTGYRLSPRGEGYLRSLRRRERRPPSTE